MIRKIKVLTLFCFIVLTAILANVFPPNAKGNTANIQKDVSGATLFANNCARCHGGDGKGGKGPDLASEKRQAKWKESDEKLVKKITKGGFFMPSFGKKLEPAEIKAIAAYVRTLKQ
ncbi:MAG: cytochrome c [Saprospiraceae bacterium]|nr:cytochrome c [Pyrinomonadaceae bacterium]